MRIRWWHWVEYFARGIVWVGALVFSLSTAVGIIPILPVKTSIALMIFVSAFFLPAMMTTLWFDMYRVFPPKRHKAK